MQTALFYTFSAMQVQARTQNSAEWNAHNCTEHWETVTVQLHTVGDVMEVQGDAYSSGEEVWHRDVEIYASADGRRWVCSIA